MILSFVMPLYSNRKRPLNSLNAYDWLLDLYLEFIIHKYNKKQYITINKLTKKKIKYNKIKPLLFLLPWSIHSSHVGKP